METNHEETKGAKTHEEELVLGDMPSSFWTNRLNVFKIVLTPTPMNTPRMVYLGFLRDSDQPTIVVQAVVNYPVPPNSSLPDGFPAMVDWIETSSEWRRRGLAKELWLGIEAHLGVEIESTEATDAGGEFLRSIGRGM